MHERSLEHESTGQFRGRSLRHRPAERVEAAEPEPPVAGVEVGETQRPDGGGKMLSSGGGGELAGDGEGGGPDASGSPENFLQSPARVAVGVGQREQVDGGDREAEAQVGPRVQWGPVVQQFELVTAAAQLERGRQIGRAHV